MNMTAHWAWALNRAEALHDSTHFSYMTDRTVFKPNALAEAIDVVRLHPSRVIAYNHDMIDDFDQPVRHRLCEWSGTLLEIPTRHLLYLSSRAIFPPCLPRMLNCIAPRSVLTAVQRRFGSVFASISPDYCFAYRCLELLDSIVYFDKGLLFHYSVDRSNGASYMRGRPSADSRDFQEQLGEMAMNQAAPIPEFHSIINAVVNEYCFVKAEARSIRFPPIDRFNYLGALERSLAHLQDKSLASRMRALLRANGWTVAQRVRWMALRLSSLLRLHALGVFRSGLILIVANARTKPAWLFLAKASIEPPASPWFEFDSTAAAMAHALRFPRRKSSNIGHLWRVLEPRGAVRRIG